MVLGKTKEIARAYLGHKVTHAVITIPCCELIITIFPQYRQLTTFPDFKEEDEEARQNLNTDVQNSGSTRIAKVQQLLKQYF